MKKKRCKVCGSTNVTTLYQAMGADNCMEPVVLRCEDCKSEEEI